MVYSRASEPRPRTSSTSSSVTSRPCTPTTRARSTGIERTAGAPCRPAGVQGGGDAGQLVVLDVEQEHVRGIGGDVHRDLAHQVLLQRPHAEDEEGPEPDGEQHQVHLAAGPGQLQRGVAQREPAARRRAAGPRRSAPVRPRRAPPATRDEADGDDGADPHRSGLPHRERHQRCRRPPAITAQRSQSRRAARRSRRAAAATASRADVEQRHEREEQRHQQPGADALGHRRRRQRCSR